MEASQEQRRVPTAKSERAAVIETDMASAADDRAHAEKIRAFKEKERATRDAQAADSKAASDTKHAELLQTLGLETQANQPDPKAQLAEARKARAEQQQKREKTGFFRRLFR